jgi:hypothetical protein
MVEGLHIKVHMLGRDASGGFRADGIHPRGVYVDGMPDFVEGWMSDEEVPHERLTADPVIEALRSERRANSPRDSLHPLFRSFHGPTLEAICARLTERLANGVRKAVVELAAEPERPLGDVLFARRAMLEVPGVARVGLRRVDPQVSPAAVRFRFVDEISLVNPDGTPIARITLTSDAAVVVDLPWSAATASKAVEGDIDRLRFALRSYFERYRSARPVTDPVMLVHTDRSAPWGLLLRMMEEWTSPPARIARMTILLNR